MQPGSVSACLACLFCEPVCQCSCSTDTQACRPVGSVLWLLGFAIGMAGTVMQALGQHW
jgi:hypothetical protein